LLPQGHSLVFPTPDKILRCSGFIFSKKFLFHDFPAYVEDFYIRDLVDQPLKPGSSISNDPSATMDQFSRIV